MRESAAYPPRIDNRRPFHQDSMVDPVSKLCLAQTSSEGFSAPRPRGRRSMQINSTTKTVADPDRIPTMLDAMNRDNTEWRSISGSARRPSQLPAFLFY